MVEVNNRSSMYQRTKVLVEDANLLQALERESPAGTCTCPSNPQHLKTCSQGCEAREGLKFMRCTRGFRHGCARTRSARERVCDPRKLIVVWWRRPDFAHAHRVGGRHVVGAGDGPLKRVCCLGRGQTETAEVPRRSQSGDDAARPVNFTPSSVSLQALQDMRKCSRSNTHTRL